MTFAGRVSSPKLHPSRLTGGHALQIGVALRVGKEQMQIHRAQEKELGSELVSR